MRIVLHLEWDDEVIANPPTKRRIAGFDAIKERIAKAQEEDIHLHAFTYAFLRKAKNVDLYADPDDTQIRQWLDDLRKSLAALEEFERDGVELTGPHSPLGPIYLELRRVFARASARDERRAMVHLLMNGPCSDADLAEDLSLSTNLAVRVRKALTPAIVPWGADNRYWISDAALPIVVFLVRESIGIDLLEGLENRIGN